MGDGQLLRPSILKLLKRNNNITTKTLLGDGKLLLDVFPNQEAVGKIVTVWNEGEFTVWPSLRHESLLQLLDVVTIDEITSLFVCPYMKISIGSLVREESFIQHPKSFERKKSYLRDVLSGLDYLHQHSVSLLNLSDQNVLICGQCDRAFVSDFSSCVLAKMTTKSKLPIDRIQFCAPELKQLKDDDVFECMPIDIWAFGVLIIQVFTKHILPKVGDFTDIFDEFTADVLLTANPGSYLTEETTCHLKEFIEPFLLRDPVKRIGAKQATELHFLRNSTERLDIQAWAFWKMKDDLDTAFPNNFDPFQSYSPRGLDPSQEKDPWEENDELQQTLLKEKSSKTFPKLGISSLNSTACDTFKNRLILDHSSNSIEGKITSPLTEQLLDNNQTSRNSQFHQEMESDNLGTQKNSQSDNTAVKRGSFIHECVGSETKFKFPADITRKNASKFEDWPKTETQQIPSISNTSVERKMFMGVPFRNEDACAETKLLFSTGLTRKNAFRFKNRPKPKNQFEPQNVDDESKSAQASFPDQVDKKTLAFLLDGTFSYNFKSSSADKKSEEVIRDLIPSVDSEKKNPENCQVEVSPLCVNVEDMVDTKFVKKDVLKKKPTHRFLRLLWPSKKTKAHSI